MELMRKILRRPEGFTLIEVMIALVLFAVGIMAFGGLEVLAIRNTTYSKDYGKANTYAQQLIEEKKGISWSNVTQGSDTPEGRFTRTWTVTTDGDIKHLAVSVSWLDPSLGTKRVSFFTDLYSNPSMP
jgi:prepilin-type N-terminal cleavage/methylation domain-containing protein